MISDELAFLYDVLKTLEAYLEDLILVGGFACLLYSSHEKTEGVATRFLITFDVDLASEGKIPLRGRKSIRESLRDAGLVDGLLGNYSEPIVKYYQEGEIGSARYVEFSAPLSGSGTRRDGRPDVTQDIQEDLPAQKLRYLDLLVQNTWDVHTSSIPVLRERPNLIVRIPHPGLYIMQKVLILQERVRSDRNKDFAYIYQTLIYLRRHLDSLASDYRDLILTPEWKKWYTRFIASCKEFFDTPEKDGPIEASRILVGIEPRMVSSLVMKFIALCPTIGRRPGSDQGK